LLICCCLSIFSALAQKQVTRTGSVSFYSSTPIEDIEANNSEAAAVLDTKTGALLFIVPIKSFRFEKALMQEHFNENYMESDRYPKAEYKGKILGQVNYNKEGTYPVTTKGALTIHGVTKNVTVPGTLIVSKGTTTINAQFTVRVADYNIKIPAITASKIASQIKINIHAILKP